MSQLEAAPSVSVIVIGYNAARFLEEAVDSVLGQTFDDWEILIVDDGSTDATNDVAHALACKRPDRIHVLQHPDRQNHGMSATRNLGLSHARGDFIGFLDADDVWLPNKLSDQIGVLNQEPRAELIYGRTLIWHSWDRNSDLTDFYYDLGVEPNRIHDPPTLFRILLANKCQTPTTCNALIRRRLFAQVGGFEPNFRGLYEDQVFFAKALIRAPAFVADQTWAKYRQHAQSCSSMATREAELRARARFLGRVAKELTQSELAMKDRVAILRMLISSRLKLAKMHLHKMNIPYWMRRDSGSNPA